MTDPSPWRTTVLTLFPEMFPGPLGVSLAGRLRRQRARWDRRRRPGGWRSRGDGDPGGRGGRGCVPKLAKAGRACL